MTDKNYVILALLRVLVLPGSGATDTTEPSAGDRTSGLTIKVGATYHVTPLDSQQALQALEARWTTSADVQRACGLEPKAEGEGEADKEGDGDGDGDGEDKKGTKKKKKTTASSLKRLLALSFGTLRGSPFHPYAQEMHPPRCHRHCHTLTRTYTCVFIEHQ